MATSASNIRTKEDKNDSMNASMKGFLFSHSTLELENSYRLGLYAHDRTE